MKQNEIEFCKFFEEVMWPNRNDINTDMVAKGMNIIGNTFFCSSCSLHNQAIDLKNLYFRLKPFYDEYKKII